MLGILFIYWIGKYFYQLAEKFNQNKWLYAILGIVIYYSGQIIGALLIAVVSELFDLGIDFDGVLINVVGILIGRIACYLFYLLLEKVWKRDVVIIKDSIQDIGKSEMD